MPCSINMDDSVEKPPIHKPKMIEWFEHWIIFSNFIIQNEADSLHEFPHTLQLNHWQMQKFKCRAMLKVKKK